jgi:hypothetical protein
MMPGRFSGWLSLALSRTVYLALRFGCRIVDGDGVDITIREALGFRCGSVVVCWWQIARRLADYC